MRLYSTIKGLTLSLAQAANGCLIYYGSLVVYDYLAGGEFAFFPALLIIVSIPIAFAGSNLAWHKLNAYSEYMPPVEFSMLAGLVLFQPFYWAMLTSATLGYTEGPFWSEVVGYYRILPLLLISGQLMPVGWALDLAFVSTLLVGLIIRQRRQPGYARGAQ